LIKLEPEQTNGFEPYSGGAFLVSDEAALRPALHALANAARDSMKETEVTLAEFARADLLSALQEFEDVRHRTHVLHVNAPVTLREDRLARRAEPPESNVTNRSVTLTLSDNHLLPSSAERSLYSADDVERLMSLPRWRGRIFEVENAVDDGGARAEVALQDFIEYVIAAYRTPADGTRSSQWRVSAEPIGAASSVPLARLSAQRS
jgi:hypothetical protein